MAQERHVSPEKQLLNLIEGGEAKASGIRPHAARHIGLKIFSIAAWKGRLSFLKEGLLGLFKKKEASLLDIKSINKCLIACLFGLLVYLVGNVSFSMSTFEKMPNLEMDMGKGAKSEALTNVQGYNKSASYYLEKTRERNIFSMGVKELKIEDSEEVDPASKLPSSEIIEATQSLVLVGISWSEDPDVMIEDSRTLRTFFVKRGQNVGKVKVEAIFKDKVILSYKGEEVELK